MSTGQYKKNSLHQICVMAIIKKNKIKQSHTKHLKSNKLKSKINCIRWMANIAQAK